MTTFVICYDIFVSQFIVNLTIFECLHPKYNIVIIKRKWIWQICIHLFRILFETTVFDASYNFGLEV